MKLKIIVFITTLILIQQGYCQYQVNIVGNADHNLRNIDSATTKSTGLLEKMNIDQKNILALQQASKNVAFEMSKMQSLNQLNTLIVVDSVTGATNSVNPDTLSYNAKKGFSGGNFANIDNLVGIGGAPIALDRMMPTTLIPLPSKVDIGNSTKALSKFGQMAGSKGTKSLFDNILGGGGSKNMIGDGVSVRDYLGVADDAFQSVNDKGSATEKMAYFASGLFGSGGSGSSSMYDPIRGNLSSLTPAIGRPNMNDILSQGAMSAVQSAISKTGGENPYASFAADVLPYATSIIKNTAPGEELIIDAATVEQAKAGGASSGGPADYVKLITEKDIIDANPAPLKESSAKTGGEFGSNKSNTASESASVKPKVAVVTPKGKDAENYKKTIESSDKRLSDNMKAYKRNGKYVEYLKNAAAGLVKMRTELTAIKESMTTETAIPEVTQMLGDINKYIIDIQSEMNKLQNEMENQKKDRMEYLTARKSYVTSIQDQLSLEATTRTYGSLSTGKQ